MILCNKDHSMLGKSVHHSEMENMEAEATFEGAKKVLIVDDDLDILNWFRMLQREGSPYSFSFLNDEREILRTMEELKPDLIFIDLVLPHINGKKLTEIIRIASVYRIPLVHMSTKEPFSGDHFENSFMRKPLERKAVDLKIRKLLKIP